MKQETNGKRAHRMGKFEFWNVSKKVRKAQNAILSEDWSEMIETTYTLNGFMKDTSWMVRAYSKTLLYV